MLSTVVLAQSGTFRTVSGTVTDQNHHPVAGAVVLLKNEDTHAVESFLTDRVGHFVFHQVSAGTDYEISAHHLQMHSKVREISKFNSKTDLVQNLEVKIE